VPVLCGFGFCFPTVWALQEDVVCLFRDDFEVVLGPPTIAAALIAAPKICRLLLKRDQ
jgi:hypothetical protein